jgi:hypothetical protein
MSSSHLRVVAHPAQQAVGHPRRAPAPLGDLEPAGRVDLHREDSGRALDDLLEILRGVVAEPLHHAEPRAHRRREHAVASRGPDEREGLDPHRDRLGVRALGDAHVHPEVLHRRVQELLEVGAQPVDFVDEEHVAAPQRGEQAHEIARTLEHRAARGADVHPHLAREEVRERRLAEAGRTEEEDVVEWLATLPGSVDGDLEVLLDGSLTHELREPRWAQGNFRRGLVRQDLGSGDLRPAHVLAAASHRTGRSARRR